MLLNQEQQDILQFLKENTSSSSQEIWRGIDSKKSYATLKRSLVSLTQRDLLLQKGVGKSTTYSLSAFYQVFAPINIEVYFKKEIDERTVQKEFNLDLMRKILNKVSLFDASELEKLEKLQSQFQKNIHALSSLEYNKEMERLAIDLSWKSSQIEGNTYSLLETERLLKEKETAQGKSKDDAIMLLNHKVAIDFIVEHSDYVNPLTLRSIEDIHRLLTQELGIEKNIRIRRVGISGTNYVPLDNEFQIKEALEELCELINDKVSVFEKSFLALLLLSYIQPFTDGNKRTARIICNAILIEKGYCPLSFRTVDALDYKKAMLIFYEQNNVQAMKKIFIEQFEFAIKTYF